MNPLRWLYKQFLGDVRDDPKPDDLIVIALPQGDEVGAMLEGKLESYGVHALPRDVSPLYRGYGNWATELELVVTRANVEEAKAILGEHAALARHARRNRRETARPPD